MILFFFDDFMIRFKATENHDVMKTPISMVEPEPTDWVMVQYICMCSTDLRQAEFGPMLI